VKSFSKSFFAFAVAIAPALAMYIVLPGTSLAGLLLIISLLLVFLSKRKFVSQTGRYVVWGVLSLSALTLVVNIRQSWFDSSVWAHNLWTTLISILPLLFLQSCANIKTFTKTVLIVATLTSIIVIIQRLQLMLSGSYTSIYLPLQMTDDVSEIGLRPVGFFREPAHACLYLLPAFYLTLISKRFVLSLLIAIGILMTESTTGFVMVAVSFAYWYFLGKKGNKLIVLAVAAGFVYLLFHNASDIIFSSTDRLSTLDSTSTLRLLGAIEVLNHFDLINFVFGIGLNQLTNFGEIVVRDPEMANYSNSVLYSIISYGAIGLSLLIIFMVHLFRKYPESRGFWIVLLGILISDQLLFSTHFLYLVSFIILFGMGKSDISSIGKSRIQPNVTNSNFICYYE